MIDSSIAIGDRVRIDAVRDYESATHIGRIGRVVALPTSRHFAYVETDAGRITAERVSAIVSGADAALDPRRLAEALIEIGHLVLGSATVTPVPDLGADHALAAETYYGVSGLSVSLDKNRDNDVVEINGAYVKREEIDALVAYLQAATRVHDATPAYGGTVPAPF